MSESPKWIAFPGRVPVCRDCGTDWQPVRRGECPACGSDAGPLTPSTTCEDLGCVDGMTVQGRAYDYDGNHEDQWAPCARRADTCDCEHVWRDRPESDSRECLICGRVA